MTDITHDHFLRRIQASEGPDLLLAQGIYADWLEEQGDPRAELLRWGIELAERYAAGVWHSLPDGDSTPAFFLWLEIFTRGLTVTTWATSARLPEGRENDGKWCLFYGDPPAMTARM